MKNTEKKKTKNKRTITTTKHYLPSPVFEEWRQFQQKVGSPPEIQPG